MTRCSMFLQLSLGLDLGLSLGLGLDLGLGLGMSSLSLNLCKDLLVRNFKGSLWVWFKYII